jgi:hypothetical protein
MVDPQRQASEKSEEKQAQIKLPKSLKAALAAVDEPWALVRPAPRQITPATGLRNEIKKALSGDRKPVPERQVMWWYPRTEALIACDPRGWNEWRELVREWRAARLYELPAAMPDDFYPRAERQEQREARWEELHRQAQSLRGPIEAMSDEEAARHFLNSFYGIAMLAGLDSTARRLTGLFERMLSQLGNAGETRKIDATYIGPEGERKPVPATLWRAIGERSIIPTWPIGPDVLYVRLFDGGGMTELGGLQFTGPVFHGSTLVGDLYATPLPVLKPQRRQRGSVDDPIWENQIYPRVLALVAKNGMRLEPRHGLQASVEDLIEEVETELLEEGLLDEFFGETARRKHAVKILDVARRRPPGPHQTPPPTRMDRASGNGDQRLPTTPDPYLAALRATGKRF